MRPSGRTALHLAHRRHDKADFRIRNPPFSGRKLAVMTEAPKKTAKKKASAGGAVKKSRTKTRAKGMNDQEMREKVLASALPHAAFDGFTDSVLQKAGRE